MSGAAVPPSNGQQVDGSFDTGDEQGGNCSATSSASVRKRIGPWALVVLLPLSMFSLMASFQQNPRVDFIGTARLKNLSKAAFTRPSDESTEFFHSSRGKDEISNVSLAIVVQLSGELGNHMCKIAAGLGVAMELRRYNVTSELKLRHQEGTTKWVPVEKNMKKCFPAATHLDVSEAQDFDPSSRTSFEQSFDGINSDDPESIHAAIRAAVQYATDSNNLTLYSAHFTLWDFYMDLYYDQFRRFFRYADDNKFCCRKRPHANETVFHYRQFATEMPKRAIELGFEEVSAINLLEQILIPSNATSVAILSRFSNEQLDDYANTLRNAGLSVRLILKQSPMQDFCFIKSAQRHIVGNARSTFFGWAALLSDSAAITAYSIDSPSQRTWAARNEIPVRQYYNWTNPKLIDRVAFPLIEQSNSSNATTR